MPTRQPGQPASGEVAPESLNARPDHAQPTEPRGGSTRRDAAFGLLALPALFAGRPADALAPAELPPVPRNCGDPGGRFIACEALQSALPPGPGRCPLCGARHRADDAP